MLGFFERQRLVKKGLASSKVRRRRTESELLQTLEHGVVAKLGIFVAFMLVLWTLIYAEGTPASNERNFIGLLVFLVALAQLWINHSSSWDKNSRLVLIFGVLGLHLALVRWGAHHC